LVLPGKREVPEAFFIEPTTGYAKATNNAEYLGIESVWNHQNLWVNMQDCSNGCDVSFDKKKKNFFFQRNILRFLVTSI
jgi:hypothetical protein